MKNNFLVLDTSCVAYFILFCFYNINESDFYKIYNYIFLLLPLIIFIFLIIQEKKINKDIKFLNLIKLFFPIVCFSYFYKIFFREIGFIDFFDIDYCFEILSISIPVLIIEFLTEQFLYNFLTKKIIK
jgi:hypothetical protein|uniref:Uncharacterized protein n=1 Tax=Siphoviridae sp. ct6rT12 TaxID=2825346 RepID=A0A8S5V9D3_9CAUD|nr:MAG TPA: hypothetical protein [Siphoviridae sp. ct6rT12]